MLKSGNYISGCAVAMLVVLMWYYVLVFYISRAFVYWNQLGHLLCYHPIIYQPFLQVTFTAIQRVARRKSGDHYIGKPYVCNVFRPRAT